MTPSGKIELEIELVNTYSARDYWAKKAKLKGFRSRAVFKIMEIDQKVDLFKNVKSILDIGSSRWLV